MPAAFFNSLHQFAICKFVEFKIGFGFEIVDLGFEIGFGFLPVLLLSLLKMGIEKQLLRELGPELVPSPSLVRTSPFTALVSEGRRSFSKVLEIDKSFLNCSTKDPGSEPFSFQIGKGKVIKGWDEGVLGMQVGEVARLTCSPDYAYGASGFPAWGIKPNSVLVFEIEVLRAV